MAHKKGIFVTRDKTKIFQPRCHIDHQLNYKEQNSILQKMYKPVCCDALSPQKISKNIADYEITEQCPSLRSYN